MGTKLNKADTKHLIVGRTYIRPYNNSKYRLLGIVDSYDNKTYAVFQDDTWPTPILYNIEYAKDFLLVKEVKKGYVRKMYITEEPINTNDCVEVTWEE